MSNRILDAVRHRVWRFRRACINRRNRLKLINKDISIISMNCTGGILYHDLGLLFRSPTINMYMRADDFIRFCEQLDEYLRIDSMTECRNPAIIGDRKYPIAILGDIHLFLVHYDSIQDAQEAWDRRKGRINKKHIVLIATDRDGMTNELKDRFEKLPYQKVMFVHQKDNVHPNCFYLDGFEDKDQVGIITEEIGWKGLRPIDQFGWISFLNNST